MNGVLMNAPLLKPDEKIIVRDIETGGLVALDRKEDFDARVHERVSLEVAPVQADIEMPVKKARTPKKKVEVVEEAVEVKEEDGELK